MKFVRGDVVLRSVPYAVVVDEEFFREICSACMKAAGELSICSKCRHLRYCSQQCQRADWSAHRKECSIFATFPENFLPNCYTRLLARCLQRHELEPEHSEEVMGVPRTVNDWVYHDEAKEESELMQFFGERYLELRSYFKKLQTVPEDVLKMFLKLWVNCQSLGGRETTVGLAVYLGQSAIDHSCVRDKRYAHFFDGITFVVKALEDADLTLADIRIEYRNLLKPRSHRIKELSRWYFTCECPMCSGRVPEIIRNPTPEKLAEISDKIKQGDRDDAILTLESYIDPKLDKLDDYVQLECAWLLAFRFLPEASRHTEAVPYLRAILEIVERVYGKDDFYLHTLRKVEKVCRLSEDALSMIENERAELRQLEKFFVS